MTPPILLTFAALTFAGIATTASSVVSSPAPDAVPGPAPGAVSTSVSVVVPVRMPTAVSLAEPARVPAAAPEAGAVEVVYSEPVSPLVVLRGFAPPATKYGPGHLGVDLSSTAGGVVLAAGDGIVTFAGRVAGRGVVVISHADGIRTEYEPLRAAVVRGARVRRGAVIGLVDGAHPGCDRPCLHWGARRGDAYLDPLSLLRPLGPVTLLPW